MCRSTTKRFQSLFGHRRHDQRGTRKNLALEYPTLLKQSLAGDQVAALTLYQGLSSCYRFVPRNREDLNAALVSLQQTQTYELRMKDGKSHHDARVFDVESELTKAFEFCDGIR
ncbi:MAG: hypothetical protein U5K38_05585 [Woeseiaceae bacterium]|nr:hypothetical protein [Woeseiaceae bacterium]